MTFDHLRARRIDGSRMAKNRRRTLQAEFRFARIALARLHGRLAARLPEHAAEIEAEAAKLLVECYPLPANSRADVEFDEREKRI